MSRAGEDEALADLRRYEVVGELGRGGQGVVHLARCRDTGEMVALKVLLAQVAVEPHARTAFLREIAANRVLRHPNIVRFHDGGSYGASFYLVCEFCAGGSLQQLLDARGGTLPPDEAVSIALQMLDGLHYAHTAELPQDGPRGLVHRDIKPTNVLLTGAGGPHTAKISDFGLAKAFDQAGLSGLTHTGTAAGTVAYMSRTQLVDYKYAKPEVDVWATAATLYRMLTGTTPRDFPPNTDPVVAVLQQAAVPSGDATRRSPVASPTSSTKR
ncbi:serine/threonine-protein kinase [Nonomuraea cypriaca]|uniref:serine/threonine-protein kinase n=1 Tax=Nonomuraea cypriaca TaxID=1187855 RepID=UPI001F4646F5|nr:serine/threonine-protein kinase [Nonomuraea cypriaca]